jgi:hypothetical protein
LGNHALTDSVLERPDHLALVLVVRVVPVLALEGEALDLVPALGLVARVRGVVQESVVAVPGLVEATVAVVAPALGEAPVCLPQYISSIDYPRRTRSWPTRYKQRRPYQSRSR